MTTLTYKTVVDYPNYEISTAGDIRKVTVNGYRVMSTRVFEKHLMVSLTNDEGRKTMPVHRLVLKAHGPEQPEHLPLALHLDDDRENNSIENLCWGDKKMNAQMAIQNGCLVDHHLKRFLSKAEADDVLALYVDGVSMKKLAVKFGCSRWTISNIVHNRVQKFL
jgi:plasmid maintenance system antidote protein VapI